MMRRGGRECVARKDERATKRTAQRSTWSVLSKAFSVRFGEERERKCKTVNEQFGDNWRSVNLEEDACCGHHQNAQGQTYVHEEKVLAPLWPRGGSRTSPRPSRVPRASGGTASHITHRSALFVLFCYLRS
jgi:hypothetical protein